MLTMGIRFNNRSPAIMSSENGNRPRRGAAHSVGTSSNAAEPSRPPTNTQDIAAVLINKINELVGAYRGLEDAFNRLAERSNAQSDAIRGLADVLVARAQPSTASTPTRKKQRRAKADAVAAP